MDKSHNPMERKASKLFSIHVYRPDQSYHLS